ncbi:major facilitator superfamily domain-containing protein [Fusarium solani]|uniref:Major facilitator superfamily domain-containing protein n=1 Tax=Fusarium solani TaxID=169388 RepID=A0A9P9KKE2_FUSSL|nr:major facilitator superfamily domain-containing protein [Fusarium solani]KAH7260385.1 major facilitator superfamily domain-containing protein [Fusarium solani]
MATGAATAPPGTVRLVLQPEESTGVSTFMLSPTPSSDPNEPLNWSNWRKCFNYGLTIAVTVAAFTNLSIQTVFWQQMTVDLGVTITQLTHAQSAQLAGLAMGCIFFIPLTIKYGRRSTYVVSTAALAAVSWWTSSISSYTELILTSIITGLAGAINETSVQMTIADLFFVHQRGSANAVYFTAVMVGSFLTPLAAGSQAAEQGWRWSYYALSIAMTALFVTFVLLFEETKFVPVSVGQTDNSTSLVATSWNQSHEYDKEDLKVDGYATTTTMTRTDSTIPINTWRQRLRFTTPTPESLPHLFVIPLHVITLPHVFFTALQFASGVCWLVLYMSVVSIIFAQPPYNFTTFGIGCMTLGPFVGNIFGSIYGGPLSDWVIVRLARRNGGVFEPEMRLYPLVVPTIAMAGGIIMFGVTADRGMHWIYPSIGGAFFAFGLGANGDITFTLIVDTYRELTAEAFIGVAFLRNAVSVAVPFALVPWMKTMGLTNMYILSGCIAFAIGLLFVSMIIWGKRIRTALAPRYWKLVEKRSMI